MEAVLVTASNRRRRLSSQNHENISPKVKRKRTKSESKQQLTFWGWSPKQAKFKPKIMDSQGALTDHPNPESIVYKSKWQPIVIYFVYLRVCFVFERCKFQVNSGVILSGKRLKIKEIKIV